MRVLGNSNGFSFYASIYGSILSLDCLKLTKSIYPQESKTDRPTDILRIFSGKTNSQHISFSEFIA